MAKIKIMVNWSERRIVHCQKPVGSPEYSRLVNSNYVEVGEIKVHEELPIFWRSEYFNAPDKYLRDTPQITTLTT